MNQIPVPLHLLQALPRPIRELLFAELGAGNYVAELGHTYPAPPVGAYFLLGRPLSAGWGAWKPELTYYNRGTAQFSGEITDDARRFFILEPARESAPSPSMDEIRLAKTLPTRKMQVKAMVEPANVARFKENMRLNFDQWHDGESYDLETLAKMTPAEQAMIEAHILQRGVNDWRDVETLAIIPTAMARAALITAAWHGAESIREAVARFAPHLAPQAHASTSLT